MSPGQFISPACLFANAVPEDENGCRRIDLFDEVTAAPALIICGQPIMTGFLSNNEF
jgi:hypothetical protein